MLEPLPYHRAVRDHLREHAAAAWQHFSSDAFEALHAEELDLALLKSTVRLDPASYAELYATARGAAAALGVEVGVELYQGTSTGGLNAALFFAPGSARIVLIGPVAERLAPDELRALFGHELAHHLLWTAERGELFTAARALAALAAAGSETVAETARMYQLATETFADRGALAASGSVDAVIRCLIKTETELSEVDVPAFLAQADEVLRKAGAGAGADGEDHPRAYVRAKAVALYAEKGTTVDRDVQALLEGKLDLHALDLLRRPELFALSREVVDHLLVPPWIHTPAILGHAKLLFDDYEVAPPERSLEQVRASLEIYGPTVLDYITFLFVDFVAVDPELDEVPLAQAMTVAERLGLLDRLERNVHRELKTTKKVIDSVRARRQALLDAAARGDDG